MAARREDLNIKSQRLSVRLSPRQRCVLETASAVEGTTLTDFVLANATRAAENLLANRRLFLLSDERWVAFESALDEPARELPRLRKLLDSPTVLDEV